MTKGRRIERMVVAALAAAALTVAVAGAADARATRTERRGSDVTAPVYQRPMKRPEARARIAPELRTERIEALRARLAEVLRRKYVF